MESGNDLLAVTGRIINPTDEVQRVPQIRAELRDAQDRIVYSWAISPPVSRAEPEPERHVQQRRSRCSAAAPSGFKPAASPSAS